MAIQVQRTGPRPVERPEKEESPLDKVLKGLQLAQAGFGIYSDISKISALKQEQALKQSEQDRLKKGIIYGKELLDKGDNYTPVAEGTPNALRFKLQEGDQSKDIFLAPKVAGATATKAAPLTQAEQAKLINDGGKFVPAGTKGSSPLLAFGPDGSPTQVGFIPAPPKADRVTDPKPDQFKVASFGRRLEQAEDVFKRLQSEGFDPTSLGVDAQRANIVPERLKSDSVKSQQQAERNFINAVLRRESGASISPAEFESAEKQYFPRGGDDPQTLEQKALNRRQVIESMRAEAGPAWDRIPRIAGTGPAKQKGNGKSPLIPEAQANRGPKVGTVQDGYIYMGGDPADQKSWQKVK